MGRRFVPFLVLCLLATSGLSGCLGSGRGSTEPPADGPRDVAADAPQPPWLFDAAGCTAHNLAHYYPAGSTQRFGPSNWSAAGPFSGAVDSVRTLLVECAAGFVLYQATSMQVDAASEHHRDGKAVVDLLIDLVTDVPTVRAAWEALGFAPRNGTLKADPAAVSASWTYAVHVDDALLVRFEVLPPFGPPAAHVFNQTYVEPTGTAWAKGYEEATSFQAAIIDFAWGPATPLQALGSGPEGTYAAKLDPVRLFVGPPGALAAAQDA